MSHKLPAVAVLALATSACFGGANVTGDQGVVRFSFVGRSAEGTDAGDAIATRTTVRVRLLHPDGSPIFYDPDAFVELHLEAAPTSGGSEASVFPTDLSEYGVYFEKAGTYQLSAMSGGQEVDSTQVIVRDPDRLVFGDRVSVTTRDGDCWTSAEASLASLDLAANQSIELLVLPQAGGRALMGTPALVADAVHGKLATPSGLSSTSLAFDLEPVDPGQAISVSATDLGNGLTASATIRTHAGKATATCR